jgi:anti-anti-sigma regulatory factor
MAPRERDNLRSGSFGGWSPRPRGPAATANSQGELPPRFAPPPLGKILEGMGELTQNQLETALARQRQTFLKANRIQPLGEILTQLRFVPSYTVRAALQEQQRRLRLAQRAWTMGVQLGGLSAAQRVDVIGRELVAAASSGLSEWESEILAEGYIAAGGREEHWQAVMSVPKPAEAPRPPAPLGRARLDRRRVRAVSSRVLEVGGCSVEVYALEGAVEFTHVAALKQKVLAEESPSTVAVDLSAATSVNIAAAGAIVDIVHKLSARDVAVAVVLPELTPSPAAGVLASIPPWAWFVSLQDALEALRKRKKS